MEFKLGESVKITKEHSFITELPDNQVFKITKRIRKETDKLLITDIYYLETPLGVKFSANDFEIERV